MDWINSVDIRFNPKRKTLTFGVQDKAITNNQEHNSDAVPDIQELIEQEYPRLIEFHEYQTITSAPFQLKVDTTDALPIVSRGYRRSPTEEKVIKEEIEKMLSAGVIIASTSDWCSNVVLVKKPDGSYLFCVDYRRLNQVTIKDKYPLPRIDEVIEQLEGSIIFSTIDLKSGYWQLPMDKQDAKKTAFTANGCLYEFTCLPFGVTNGPSYFMRYMHTVLKGIKHTLVYLDDIICFNSSFSDHPVTPHEVLKRLDDYNLKISTNKCYFLNKRFNFLGFY